MEQADGDLRKPINLQALKAIRNATLQKENKGSQTNLDEIINKSDQNDFRDRSPTFHDPKSFLTEKKIQITTLKNQKDASLELQNSISNSTEYRE